MLVRNILCILLIIPFFISCTLDTQKKSAIKLDNHTALWDVKEVKKIQVIEVEDYSNLTDTQIEQVEQLKEIWRRMFKLNQYDKSIEAYLKILDITQNDFEAYYRIGNSYNSLGNFEKAVEYFRKSTQLRPDLAYISNALLAFSYYHLWDSNKAFLYHKKATTQNSDYFYWYEFLRTFNKDKWSIEDIEEFELKQIDRFYNFYNNPENSQLVKFFDATWRYGFSELTVAHIYESLWLMVMKQNEPNYEKSAEYFKKAYETVPYINAYDLLWQSYYKSEKYNEAIEVFKNLNEFAPTHLKSYIILLDIYEKHENIEEWKIVLFSLKNMLDFYEENWYWNPNSYFAQSNFINKDSKKDYNDAYIYYQSIFK